MNVTRRSLLASVGAAGTVGVAGCLGDDGPDVPDYDCDFDGPPEIVDELPQPTLGDPDAAVTVSVFEDFGCPACRQFKLEEFPTLREEYLDTDEVRYEHWDFPVGASDWSRPVANAARGVQERVGDEAFFAFASVAYEYQEHHSDDVVGFAAEEAGDEPCMAIRDAEFGPYEGVLDANFDEARARGAEATPTAFVDGEAVEASSGIVSAEDIADAIEAARN